jgi:uncharacterized OB-fold protein
MSGEPKPVPRPTPETRPYWEATRRRQLVHHRCEGCGAGSQHPRAVCACGSTDLTWTPCSGRGRLFSYVVVHRPEPVFADEAPFVLATVELEEGVRMTTRIVDVPADPAALPLDMELELRWLERGDVNLPVFAPAGPEGA